MFPKCMQLTLAMKTDRTALSSRQLAIRLSVGCPRKIKTLRSAERPCSSRKQSGPPYPQQRCRREMSETRGDDKTFEASCFYSAPV